MKSTSVKALLVGRFNPDEANRWRAALAAALPHVQWLSAEETHAQASDITVAVVANPAPGALQGLPNLRLVQSLWAGVDKLLVDATVPAHVPLARMVDPAMNEAMAQTALWAVLSLHRGFFAYAQAQQQSLWRQHAQQRAADVGVLVLGQGQMGAQCSQRLAQLGYSVQGWRRGEQLAPLLAQANIVINLLPLTPQTHGLLNASFFAALPPKSSVVNLGRGAHVVDADVLAALQSGQLSHAVLDVFHQEPLPADHPFWRHPQVTVLPHAAALTNEISATAVVAHNFNALATGQPLLHVVDRQRGY
jgi:glyoxylate/hydroxypyruvate reductase